MRRLRRARARRRGLTGPPPHRPSPYFLYRRALLQTNQAIEFHNDGSDAFAVCCVHAGREGGMSRLVSAVTVFSEVAQRRPDLAEALQQPFNFEARGQHPDGDRCQVIPVYSFAEGAIARPSASTMCRR